MQVISSGNCIYTYIMSLSNYHTNTGTAEQKSKRVSYAYGVSRIEIVCQANSSIPKQ